MSWGITWRAVGVSPPSCTYLTRRAYAAPLAGLRDAGCRMRKAIAGGSVSAVSCRSFLPERTSQPRCDLRPDMSPQQNHVIGDHDTASCFAMLASRLRFALRQFGKSFPAERTYVTQTFHRHGIERVLRIVVVFCLRRGRGRHVRRSANLNLIGRSWHSVRKIRESGLGVSDPVPSSPLLSCRQSS